MQGEERGGDGVKEWEEVGVARGSTASNGVI